MPDAGQIETAHARVEHDLIAIANAGPIWAFRLRRQLRAKLLET